MSKSTVPFVNLAPDKPAGKWVWCCGGCGVCGFEPLLGFAFVGPVKGFLMGVPGRRGRGKDVLEVCYASYH